MNDALVAEAQSLIPIASRQSSEDADVWFRQGARRQKQSAGGYDQGGF